MLNALFQSHEISTIGGFLLCLGCALVCGTALTFTCLFRGRCTRSFHIALTLLPAVVCVVILMVNGNVGTGVAVAGAFGLVRFRSAPGTAREITLLFLAMGAGLIAGTGYLGYALLFTVIMCLLYILCSSFSFGERTAARDKTLQITIPEDLDYSAFDAILDTYAIRWELTQVKTTNMGSMFRLTYRLTLHKDAPEKEMIDKLRCHNGNLEILLSRQQTESEL